MPFSVVFYKWMLGKEDSLNLEDLIHVDANLYEQFKRLRAVVLLRDKLMAQNQLANQQLTTNKLNNKKRLKSKDDSAFDSSPGANAFDENDDRLLLDGCKIDDLSLVFTLPGHPNIELKKGGKDCLVTIHNLDQYVDVSAKRSASTGYRHFLLVVGRLLDVDRRRPTAIRIIPRWIQFDILHAPLEMLLSG